MFSALGTIVSIGQTETVGANAREKRDLVIEYDKDSKYPKKLVVTFWGDRMSILDSYSDGDAVEVKFRIESRENRGRWFTNCTAIAIDKSEGGSPDAPPPQEPEGEMPF